MTSYREQIVSTLALIERWLDFASWYHVVPGLAVGIQVGDEVVFEQGFGYADIDDRRLVSVDTKYRIASHSKLFTATAIMRLVDAGRLQLDDPVARHVPWFRSAADPNMAAMTLRALLTHASGMNRDGETAHWQNDEFPDQASLEAQVAAGVSVFETGEHWKYSNLAYTVLGQAVAAVTGQSYEAAVRELVIDALGLSATSPDFDDASLADHATGYGIRYPGARRERFDHVHARVMNSATGFSSTVRDLLAFYAAHRPGDDRLLSDVAKREMHRTQFEDGEYRWAIGFSVDQSAGVRSFGHGGAYPGFMTASARLPEYDTALVVLTNAMDGRPQFFLDGMTQLIRYAIEQAEALRATASDDPGFYDRLAGTYGSRWGVFIAGRLGGRLVTLPTAASDPAAAIARLEHQGEQRFKAIAGPQNGSFGEVSSIVEVDGEFRLRTGFAEQRPFRYQRDAAWLDQ